jgi:hypothetical protein
LRGAERRSNPRLSSLLTQGKSTPSVIARHEVPWQSIFYNNKKYHYIKVDNCFLFRLWIASPLKRLAMTQPLLSLRGTKCRGNPFILLYKAALFRYCERSEAIIHTFCHCEERRDDAIYQTTKTIPPFRVF